VQGNHVATRNALGVNVIAGTGVSVYSVSGGYVQEIGNSYIVVNDTVHTYKYGNLGRIAVRQNQPVEAGVTVLGTVGTSGGSRPFVSLEIQELSTSSFINRKRQTGHTLNQPRPGVIITPKTRIGGYLF
jgi:hypothetical protein